MSQGSYRNFGAKPNGVPCQDSHPDRGHTLHPPARTALVLRAYANPVVREIPMSVDVHQLDTSCW
jgi:hypothetical protein